MSVAGIPEERNMADHTNIEYADDKARFSDLDKMWVEKGSKRDWDYLHDLHYKAESLPAGPHFWRCVYENEETGEHRVVGIVVLSSVSLLLAPRHILLPKLKPGQDTKITNKYRAVWLNANMRRAARIVTDTMYRGVGVSYRMVNLACRMEGRRYVEIQSSMSKFNPFDQKAGFQHAPLKRAAAFEPGLKFFRSYFQSNPADFQAIMLELEQMRPEAQKVVIGKMKEFYYKHSAKEKTGSNLNSGTGKVNEMPTKQMLKELQQLVFASPVYGLYENPDFGRELPERLPLRAYDWQKPNEALKLENIK
jgi:ABC-type ATPase with predicted acetyltransferase domain